MDLRVCVCITVFWLRSLIEIHSQTFPHVTFMGNTIPNHGYVNLSSEGDNVTCVTDLSTCCSGTEGGHRGDWYFPNGTRLPFSGGIYESRGAQRVDILRRNNANSPVGIYRCDVQTNAVHDDTDISVRDTVYVGRYTASGGMFALSLFDTPQRYLLSDSGDITISGGVTYDSDQLTLTCISTGGPATTVSWTRDSTTVITEGTQTVLNDPEIARYTHTLNISLAGEYTCTVANNKPSSASVSINVEGIYSTKSVIKVCNNSACLRSPTSH